MSDSLWPRGLQHTRPLCPSLSPEVCPSSCPLHWWCHPTISSSDALSSFCPQSFPASGNFPVSQLFTADDQNTRVSTSASVHPTSIQGWFHLRLTGLISLLFKGLSGVFPSITVQRRWGARGDGRGSCAQLLQLLQLRLTLFDPMDCSPSGSSVHGILQAGVTGVGCHLLLQGIFPTQGSNPRLLCLPCWQADFLPLAPPGKPLVSSSD